MFRLVCFVYLLWSLFWHAPLWLELLQFAKDMTQDGEDGEDEKEEPVEEQPKKHRTMHG